MEEKINVAEILRNCQSGMELDCTMYNKVTLLNVDDGKNRIFPIRVLREDGNIIALTKYGQYTNEDFAKCVIFPKGKTTWEGFQGPVKDGNVVVCEDQKKITQMFIVQSEREEGIGKCYFGYDFENDDFFKEDIWHWDRLATEEEKQRLFDVIKANGYRWNEETKTLEKLPNFKVGDWVVNMYGKVNQVVATDDICNGFALDNNLYFRGYLKDTYHLWTIQDAKEGDVLSNGEMIVIFKHFEEPSYRQHIVAYIGLDTSGDIQITDDTWNLGIDKIKPATKEQRDLLFQKMKEAGYEWDAEKKELNEIEPKSALSEEDINTLNRVSAILVNASEVKNWWKEYRLIEKDEMIRLTDFLKSLKDRCTWKPSDEQMEQLGWIAEQNKNNMIGKELMTLYNDLKKLKE